MEFREFIRYHLFKVLVGLVVLQLAALAVIQNYNHRPVAESDRADLIEDNTVKIAPLVNDTDRDSETELKISGFTKPLNGKVKQEGKLFFYTPNPDYVGLDSFAYTINDGRKESREGYILINIHKNQVPQAGNDHFYIYPGTSLNLDVFKNDSDEENDSLFILEYSQPLSGKLEKTGNSFRYTAGASGGVTDSFLYRIGDVKNISEEALVKIEILQRSDPRYPWLSSDVGDAALQGDFSVGKGKFTLKGSGSDIWSNGDGFRFVYQSVSGDFDIRIRVDSLIANHEWAKAGIMARESLEGGSKHTFICQSNRNGVTLHQRLEKDVFTQGGNSNGEIAAPCSLRLKRSGDNFTYLYARDGQSWTELATLELNLPGEIYLGLALTSHDNSAVAKAIFSDLRLSK